jgi:hypothetical protein
VFENEEIVARSFGKQHVGHPVSPTRGIPEQLLPRAYCRLRSRLDRRGGCRDRCKKIQEAGWKGVRPS